MVKSFYWCGNCQFMPKEEISQVTCHCLGKKTKIYEICEETKTLHFTDNVSGGWYINTFGFFDKFAIEQVENITFSQEITNFKLREFLFKVLKSLKKIELPECIERLGNRVFSGCTNLEEVVFTHTLKYIGEECFKDCNSLYKLDIPDTVETIRTGAFVSCTSLENFNIPKGVQILEDNLFENCSSLERVYLHEDVKEIYDGVFNRCINLQRVYIPSGVTYVGIDVFLFTSQELVIEIGHYKDDMEDAEKEKYNYLPLCHRRCTWTYDKKVPYGEYGTCKSRKTSYVFDNKILKTNTIVSPEGITQPLSFSSFDGTEFSIPSEIWTQGNKSLKTLLREVHPDMEDLKGEFSLMLDCHEEPIDDTTPMDILNMVFAHQLDLDKTICIVW